jgi:hypothetical protein
MPLLWSAGILPAFVGATARHFRQKEKGKSSLIARRAAARFHHTVTYAPVRTLPRLAAGM